MDSLVPDVLTVIHRALALQLIIDRGWAAKYIFFEKERKAKKVNKMVMQWDKREGISKWLTDNERTIWDKPIDTLKEEEMGPCTWQVEALVPLLWALGLIDTMPEFSEYAKDEHCKKLHFCEGKPVKKILKDLNCEAHAPLARKPEEVELQANVYMLVNWCCIEYLLHKNKKIDMKKIPKELFGESITKAVELLPLHKNGELLMESRSLILSELRKSDVQTLQMLVERRQHALNWLMGQDENWDDISTDT